MTASAEVWEYKDSVHATQLPTYCPTCGQECDSYAVKGSLWHGLVMFIAGAVAGAQGPVDVHRLVRERESMLSATDRKRLQHRSTFRVQRNVLAKCVALGIPLLRIDGRPRGKTELEHAIKGQSHEPS